MLGCAATAPWGSFSATLHRGMAVTASTVKSERGVSDDRDFRLYLSGLFLGTLAIQIQSVAVGWQVYNITSSPLALGYVGLAQFLPMAACTLPAGNTADRFERRLIIVIGYFAQAVAAGLFLALSLMKVRDVRSFYAVLALFAAARAFAGPASQSFVPMLVPQDRFPQAVAWSSATSKIAVIVGPALGGAIYILGPAVAYGVCLILFIVVLIFGTSRIPELGRGLGEGIKNFKKAVKGDEEPQKKS